MDRTGVRIPHAHAHTRTLTHSRTHSLTLSHSFSLTETHMHTHSHTLTHTHTLTHSLCIGLCWLMKACEFCCCCCRYVKGVSLKQAHTQMMQLPSGSDVKSKLYAAGKLLMQHVLKVRQPSHIPHASLQCSAVSIPWQAIIGNYLCQLLQRRHSFVAPEQQTATKLGEHPCKCKVKGHLNLHARIHNNEHAVTHTGLAHLHMIALACCMSEQASDGLVQSTC